MSDFRRRAAGDRCLIFFLVFCPPARTTARPARSGGASARADLNGRQGGTPALVPASPARGPFPAADPGRAHPRRRSVVGRFSRGARTGSTQPAWTVSPGAVEHVARSTMNAASLRQRLGRPTRRSLSLLVGIAALLAGGTAAAVVATSGSHDATPTVRASDAALDTKDALASILHLHPALGHPVAKLISDGKLPKATYVGDSSTIGVPKNTPVQTAPTTNNGNAAAFVPGPAGDALTPLQLASLAMSQGCPAADAATAAAIAAAESGGNPAAQGDITLMDNVWDWSEGLWQIRGLRDERGTGELRDSLANGNPVTNARAMMTISDGCTNWTPWSTYNSGAYLAYLPLMKSAVAAALGYRSRTGSWLQVLSGAPATVPTTGGQGGRGTHSKHWRGKGAAHRKHGRHGKHGKHAKTKGKHGPKPSASPTATRH